MTDKPSQRHTIGEGKQWLRENFESGVNCPCCSQFVKLYKRKITSSMAYGLVLLHKHHKVGDIVHLENFFKSLEGVPSSIRGDISKLRFWGLLEAIEGEREDGNPSNGHYMLTAKGKDFAMDRINIPARVKIFNNRFFGFDGDEVGVRDVMQSQFDYDELLKS